MATVSAPDVKFSGLYYSAALQDLLVYRRTNVPEITDEDPHEPFNQILRAIALSIHYMSVLLDHVSAESMLETCVLRESLRNHLALIGVTLDQPSAASVEMIVELASIPSVATSITALTKFGTPRTETTDEVIFELQTAYSLTASDELTYCYGDDGGVFTDHTSDANDVPTSFTPWAAAPAAGDALYIGHDTTMFDKVVIDVTTLGDFWGDDDHAWEYYDGQTDDTAPTSVADLGGTIRFNITSLVGSNDRHGLTVRIHCQITGEYEDVTSTYAGGINYATTTGVLGQSVVSTTTSDYLIGAEWKEPDGVTETTSTTEASVEFTLPETTVRKWQETSVNSATAFWLRLRVVNATAVSPTISHIEIDEGTQYVKVTCAQGTTVADDPMGSSTGLADQTFETSQGDIVNGTLAVSVDEGSGSVLWAEVDNFLSSLSTSRHYTAIYDDDGIATVRFGDGTNGKIPPTGVNNVTATYRVGASENGNVGANAITENRGGLSLAAAVYNPRPATGWAMADGADADDIDRMRVAGPADLRALNRALNVDDVTTLALDFVTDAGTSPVGRAYAEEEGYGPKTVKLLVVGTSGAAVPSADLTELDTYFNGDPTTGEDGVIILNTEVTSVNFTQSSVDVTATVAGGTQAAIETVLAEFLSPLAQDDDGNYIHSFGGTLYTSRIIAEIFSVSGVTNVTLAAPAADVSLADDELPVPGTLTITVT